MTYISYETQEIDIDNLVGFTMSSVSGMEKESTEVVFITECGKKFLMMHQQDCCEHVSLEDVCGDPADLVGVPILAASEETSGYEAEERYGDDGTWTFYRITTINGTVTLRWLGVSNGYYSESVNIFDITGEDNS